MTGNNVPESVSQGWNFDARMQPFDKVGCVPSSRSPRVIEMLLLVWVHATSMNLALNLPILSI